MKNLVLPLLFLLKQLTSVSEHFYEMERKRERDREKENKIRKNVNQTKF